ncbi:MAG TPA: GNAT family N-acetyltransferase [Symbiobacteriaceae bacterium]|nr:GNAT family N-acetyltransferase [Symbiobacteriaceae bacterium]
MSNWTLRPLAVPDDFPRIAAITTACMPEPTTVEDLLEQEAKSKFESAFRPVIVDGDGIVGGYGYSRRYPEDPPGHFYVRAFVDPALRAQGLGTALADALEAWTEKQGGTCFISAVRDNDPKSLAFARQHGYRLWRHLFESTLDHNVFDEAPFSGVIEQVEASGIHFFTLADDPGEETARKLYELYNRTAWDIPGFDLTVYPPYEEWHDWIIAGERCRPELVIIAADGDHFAGCTVMFPNRVTGVLYTDYTCVDREYRGRHIALALKLLSIRAARRFGAPYMRTNNDSDNAPMLAVNRRLGYVPRPGLYRMRKEK